MPNDDRPHLNPGTAPAIPVRAAEVIERPATAARPLGPPPLPGETLPQYLDRYLTATGQRMSDLAKRLGCTDTSVAIWRRGQGYPSPAMGVRLAMVLGLTAEDVGGLLMRQAVAVHGASILAEAQAAAEAAAKATAEDLRRLSPATAAPATTTTPVGG